MSTLKETALDCRLRISDYFEAVPQVSYRARNAQGGLVDGVLIARRAVPPPNRASACIRSRANSPDHPEAGAKATIDRARDTNLKIPHSQLPFHGQLGHSDGRMTLDEGLSSWRSVQTTARTTMTARCIRRGYGEVSRKRCAFSRIFEAFT